MKPTFFKSAANFRQWLEVYHDSARSLLVGFYKKGSARGGITYPEALDEALAFGWIDGVRKRIDGDSYMIRFTPRKPSSIWSQVNIQRVRELSARGVMKPSGLRAFANRDEQKARQYSYERQHVELDQDLATTLRAKQEGLSIFRCAAD